MIGAGTGRKPGLFKGPDGLRRVASSSYASRRIVSAALWLTLGSLAAGGTHATALLRRGWIASGGQKHRSTA